MHDLITYSVNFAAIIGTTVHYYALRRFYMGGPIIQFDSFKTSCIEVTDEYYPATHPKSNLHNDHIRRR